MHDKLEQLIEYCYKSNISYSYKPVLIMALVENGGEVSVQEAANYFIQYYGNRLSAGLVAERENSIYSSLNCTFEQVMANIKANPVKALLNSVFFVYDSRRELLSFTSEIRLGLTAAYAQKLIQACLTRLDEYYERIRDVIPQSFVFFHNPKSADGYLSNGYPSPFSFLGQKFTTVEQYKMYRKAIMFGDTVARNKILLTDDVEEIRQIGRSVKNYNEKIWSGQRQLIVYQGLLAKFMQNDELRGKLLNTGGLILAECSASDRIWETGISMNDDRRYLVNQWQGENLLGFSLMQVRNMLQETRSL